ncbi:hypothetical protein [Clostridium felsineum]|uniref:hypothetical protein n=1 Tax=Clostridium felsineum TaxID=36839 RepID=UPI0009CE420B|nr:hypothetical protein [Clostridium felsineum]URZ17116.1 hypothetical protein CLFE_031680 [Clostridium felsineum DSM 794]
MNRWKFKLAVSLCAIVVAILSIRDKNIVTAILYILLAIVYGIAAAYNYKKGEKS